ncbi:hypothetical protein [Aquisalibacillus elongatus]|uniref:Uncharacterized protein n=1 Tax=Aquisalibacillus elongatus TaxID=485577 RepID=A0A3N5B0J7_9BACI|nr:hypothetical protein [Aquisalibacillus elongatus]RPF51086.1 hypothetical protein EDC24_2351 [Aquisalibacillus elongatus]
MKNTFILRALTVTALGLFLVACGGENEDQEQDNNSENGKENTSQESDDQNTDEEEQSQNEEETDEDESGDSLSDLPDAIPSDFPFPENATQVMVTESEMSGSTLYTVNFMFDGDPSELFNSIKDYVTQNDYSIEFEDENQEFTLDAVNYDTLEGIDISSMLERSTGIAVGLSFTVPNE